MLKVISVSLLCLCTASAAIAQKTAADLYNEGIKFKADEKYNEAVAAFKDAIAKKPDYADALYEAGWCCNELEDYENAITYLQKASELESSTSKIFFELAYAYGNADKTDEAKENYKKTLELNPEYYDADKYLGDIYYKEEDYATALDYYKKYIDGDQAAETDYYYKAGWCSNDQEKYADALLYLEKFHPDEQKDIAKKYVELGYAYYRLEDNDEAIDAYQKALDAQPNYGPALRGMGDVYYSNVEDYVKALEYFNRALEYDEENSKACYYKIGWIYNEQEKYDESITALQKAIEYDAKDAGSREELGYAYYMRDKYDDALYQLNQAIELDPQSKLGYYYKGLCYVAMDQKDNAMEVYGKLKTINTEQAEKLLNTINGN